MKKKEEPVKTVTKKKKSVAAEAVAEVKKEARRSVPAVVADVERMLSRPVLAQEQQANRLSVHQAAVPRQELFREGFQWS